MIPVPGTRYRRSIEFLPKTLLAGITHITILHDLLKNSLSCYNYRNLLSKSKRVSLTMRQRILGISRIQKILMLQAFTAFKLGRKNLRLASSMAVQSPKKLLPYQAPSFARHFKNAPNYRLRLANLPTPLQDIVLSNCVACTENSVLQPLRDLNIQLLVKRDDMTAGVELGGNKIRKLEFLLADAQDGDYDSVITIGGEQSNHCRATVSSGLILGFTMRFFKKDSLLISFPFALGHCLPDGGARTSSYPKNETSE